MNAKNTSGRFVWHELTTSDVESAKGFYGELFGWKARPMNVGPNGSYWLLSAGDKDIAGITTLSSGSPRWLSYLSHPDVDQAVSTAKAAGATLEGKVIDVQNVGRYAELRHPEAGAFAAMTMKDEGADEETSGLGTFCWNELVAQNPAAAASFYQKVFGYAVESKDMGMPEPYTLLLRGQRQAAGIMKAMDPKAKTSWLGYVAVADLEASQSKAKKLGATDILPTMSVAGLGRFSVHSDRQGVMIALFQGA